TAARPRGGGIGLRAASGSSDGHRLEGARRAAAAACRERRTLRVDKGLAFVSRGRSPATPLRRRAPSRARKCSRTCSCARARGRVSRSVPGPRSALLSCLLMAKLLLSTAAAQQAIELRAINSLGRHPNNTIQLLDKIVSKEHCIVEVRDGRFVLRDLGSLNGTYVNGERVRGEMPLKHGDEIALGSTRARFDDGSGVALPLPPVGPGAAQTPIASWPATNATAPHSPQALAGQQVLQAPPPMRPQSYSAPVVPTAVPLPPP